METQINLIVKERKRQDKKWGADRDLHDMEWLTILIEEVGESAEAILKGLPSKQDEVTQIAAVALAWLECITRRAAHLRVHTDKNQDGACQSDHDALSKAGWRYCGSCGRFIAPS